MLGLKRQYCVAGNLLPLQGGDVVCPSPNKQEERGKMKKKSTVTHNIAIAAECPPIWDVADITQVAVDALSPTGIHVKEIEVTQNVQMGVKDAIVVTAVMGIFGAGVTYGTLALVGVIGTGIQGIVERRKARIATITYPEKEQS